jgi:hypothetical protein
MNGGGRRAERPDPGQIRVIQALDKLNTGRTELNAVRTAERLDRGRFAMTVSRRRGHPYRRNRARNARFRPGCIGCGGGI